MPKTINLTLNGKPITFTANAYVCDDDVCAEATILEENEGSWKQTYFPDLPEKQLWRQQKDFDQLYEKLEEELTKHIKEVFPDMDIDWNTVAYNELLVSDNNFKMTVLTNN